MSTWRPNRGCYRLVCDLPHNPFLGPNPRGGPDRRPLGKQENKNYVAIWKCAQLMTEKGPGVRSCLRKHQRTQSLSWEVVPAFLKVVAFQVDDGTSHRKGLGPTGSAFTSSALGHLYLLRWFGC